MTNDSAPQQMLDSSGHTDSYDSSAAVLQAGKLWLLDLRTEPKYA